MSTFAELQERAVRVKDELLILDALVQYLRLFGAPLPQEGLALQDLELPATTSIAAQDAVLSDVCRLLDSRYAELAAVYATPLGAAAVAPVLPATRRTPSAKGQKGQTNGRTDTRPPGRRRASNRKASL